MPVNFKEILEALEDLAANQNMRVTVKSSLVASAVTAGTTLLGGLLLGRYGLAVGALLGGTIGYLVSDDFKSVAAVIREDMSDAERKKLAQHIIAAFKEFSAKDFISLAALIGAMRTPNHSFQDIAIEVTKKFFVEEMQRTIID